MDDPLFQLQQQLKVLRQSYAEELPAKIDAIKRELHRIQQHSDEAGLKELIRMAHSLAGSGATFGFASVSHIALRLEEMLYVYKQQLFIPPVLPDKLEELIAALELAAHDSPAIDVDTPIPLLKLHGEHGKTILVALISDEPAFAKQVQAHLEHCGMTVRLFSASVESFSQVFRENADAVLIGRTSGMTPIQAIEELERHGFGPEKRPPLFVISSLEAIEIRLSAVRAGAAAYFLEPLDLNALVKAIYDRLPGPEEPPYRVLIIDDDEAVAHYTALVLQRAGMETQVVTKPLQALEPLIKFEPELILLDLYMPDCSGLELAGIIRQQYAFTGTSIVFFSVETDIDCHIDALRSGGDMFFVKPMDPKRLVAAVEAQAKRSRVVRSLMMCDGLTGLLNRTMFDDYLKRELAQCQRNQRVFTYAILDIDHFKQVNDSYGHAAGDRALKALSLMLTHRLRGVDIIGRYGGEEFTLILPDTTPAQAALVMQEMLTAFSKLEHHWLDQTFSLTFSVGIAGYPDYTDSSAIQEAADKALYCAKAAGRNQIKLASD